MLICASSAKIRKSTQMRLVAHFPQQMLRNALYQYTICTVPQNKSPANAKFSEFRNNQNLRMETLLKTLRSDKSCQLKRLNSLSST